MLIVPHDLSNSGNDGIRAGCNHHRKCCGNCFSVLIIVDTCCSYGSMFYLLLVLPGYEHLPVYISQKLKTSVFESS